MGKAGILIPPFEIKRYGPGEKVERPLPGDFLLTHSNGFTCALIRFGQELRYRDEARVFAHWSHAALFTREDGTIVEAVETGVQQRNVSVYNPTEYLVIHLLEALDENRSHAVAFAEHCLNEGYGYMTDFSLGLSLLTGWRFFFGVDGQFICSGLVSRALERMGAIFRYDSWHMLPADLAEAFDVKPELAGSKGEVPDKLEGVTRRSNSAQTAKSPGS